jgi:hypothetical protein
MGPLDPDGIETTWHRELLFQDLLKLNAWGEAPVRHFHLSLQRRQITGSIFDIFG